MWKRGDHGRRIEALRETDGFATVPYHYARATFLSRRSGQQSRESWKVKVLPPSIARFGRLAYPLLGEVTDRDMRGRKSHGCPVVGDRRWVVAMGVGLRASAKALGHPPNPTAATQGLTRTLRCGGNDLGGEQTRRPEHERMAAAPKSIPGLKSLSGILWSADPVRKWGRPMPCGKKRVCAPWGPPG